MLAELWLRGSEGRVDGGGRRRSVRLLDKELTVRLKRESVRLEKRPSVRLEKRGSVRLERPSVRLEGESVRLEKRPSVRLERESVRLEKRGSVRLEKRGSVRLEKRRSVRLEKRESVRLERPSVRLEKRGSVRLEKRRSVTLGKRRSVRLEKKNGIGLGILAEPWLHGEGAPRRRSVRLEERRTKDVRRRMFGKRLTSVVKSITRTVRKTSSSVRYVKRLSLRHRHARHQERLATPRPDTTLSQGRLFSLISGSHLLILLDFDNWSCFFKRLPAPLPPRVFVWAFEAAARRSEAAGGCWPAFTRLLRERMFYLNPWKTNHKNSADFAMAVEAGRADERLGKHIPFLIISGDKGMAQIVTSIRCGGRRIDQVNPHAISETGLLDVIYRCTTQQAY